MEAITSGGPQTITQLAAQNLPQGAYPCSVCHATTFGLTLNILREILRIEYITVRFIKKGVIVLEDHVVKRSL